MCNYCLYKRKDDSAGNGGDGELHRAIPVKHGTESPPPPPPQPPVAASAAATETPTPNGETRWAVVF